MNQNISQNCLSLTANTTLNHDKPLQHNTNLTQSAVSPDNYTDAITCAHYNISQNCLSLTANTTLNHD
ncbi:MAG: hypothetical protein ACO293_04435, partial [Nitrosopumilaceae archaeon]